LTKTLTVRVAIAVSSLSVEKPPVAVLPFAIELTVSV